MATQKGTQPGGRAVKLRGLVYIHQHPFGGWVARTWPKKQPQRTMTGNGVTMQQFSLVGASVQRAQTWEVEAAKAQTLNSGYTWKDYYIGTLYGRGVNVDFLDGTIWRSARVLATEVQLLLDSITNQPGALLYRDVTGWLGLYKGTDKQVLTSLDSSVGPVWADPPEPSGATGATYFYAMSPVASETDSYSSLGEVFVAD